MFKLYFLDNLNSEPRQIELTKSNTSLSYELNVDDPTEFAKLRSIVNNRDVYCMFDPYRKELYGEHTLIHESTRDLLEELYYKLNDEI